MKKKSSNLNNSNLEKNEETFNKPEIIPGMHLLTKLKEKNAIEKENKKQRKSVIKNSTTKLKRNTSIKLAEETLIEDKHTEPNKKIKKKSTVNSIESNKLQAMDTNLADEKILSVNKSTRKSKRAASLASTKDILKYNTDVEDTSNNDSDLEQNMKRRTKSKNYKENLEILVEDTENEENIDKNQTSADLTPNEIKTTRSKSLMVKVNEKEPSENETKQDKKLKRSKLKRKITKNVDESSNEISNELTVQLINIDDQLLKEKIIQRTENTINQDSLQMDVDKSNIDEDSNDNLKMTVLERVKAKKSKSLVNKNTLNQDDSQMVVDKTNNDGANNDDLKTSVKAKKSKSLVNKNTLNQDGVNNDNLITSVKENARTKKSKSMVDKNPENLEEKTTKIPGLIMTQQLKNRKSIDTKVESEKNIENIKKTENIIDKKQDIPSFEINHIKFNSYSRKSRSSIHNIDTIDEEENNTEAPAIKSEIKLADLSKSYLKEDDVIEESPVKTPITIKRSVPVPKYDLSAIFKKDNNNDLKKRRKSKLIEDYTPANPKVPGLANIQQLKNRKSNSMEAKNLKPTPLLSIMNVKPANEANDIIPGVKISEEAQSRKRTIVTESPIGMPNAKRQKTDFTELISTSFTKKTKSDGTEMFLTPCGTSNSASKTIGRNRSILNTSRHSLKVDESPIPVKRRPTVQFLDVVECKEIQGNSFDSMDCDDTPVLNTQSLNIVQQPINFEASSHFLPHTPNPKTQLLPNNNYSPVKSVPFDPSNAMPYRTNSLSDLMYDRQITQEDIVNYLNQKRNVDPPVEQTNNNNKEDKQEESSRCSLM